MKNWFLLHTTQNAAQANIIKGMLEENNIPATILNKQSSSYVNFGEIEIYVPAHLNILAKNLLHKALMN